MGIFEGIFGSSETIYFPGCYSSAFLSSKIENYKRILKKIKVDFSVQKDVCCGGFLEESGYEKQLRKLARENKEFFENKKTKKIITNCPLCLATLNNYKNLIPNWSIESEFILQTIFNKLLSNPALIKSYVYESVAYYDSCCLARTLQFTDTPRELLKMLGYSLIELPKTREETICCGSCGGLPDTNQELADKIAKDFIKILKRKNIKRIVTADPRAYKHLKENFKALEIYPEDIQLLEISDIICDSLGIEKE